MLRAIVILSFVSYAVGCTVGDTRLATSGTNALTDDGEGTAWVGLDQSECHNDPNVWGIGEVSGTTPHTSYPSGCINDLSYPTWKFWNSNGGSNCGSNGDCWQKCISTTASTVGCPADNPITYVTSGASNVFPDYSLPSQTLSLSITECEALPDYAGEVMFHGSYGDNQYPFGCITIDGVPRFQRETISTVLWPLADCSSTNQCIRKCYVAGCMDDTYDTYDPANTIDKIFDFHSEGNNDPCECDAGKSRVGNSCVDAVQGCMDDTYDNYDPAANSDNGSCACATGKSRVGNSCVVLGCTDPDFEEFSASATSDDGSCATLSCGGLKSRYQTKSCCSN